MNESVAEVTFELTFEGGLEFEKQGEKRHSRQKKQPKPVVLKARSLGQQYQHPL